MITDVGKGIIARKLSGITDSCFDYLALGIGSRPSPPGTAGTTAGGEHQSGPLTQMRHEVLRVPITSAMPLDTGQIKCVAEIPSSFTCEFTEVGLWTHRENAGSARPASQQLLKFNTFENWQYFNATKNGTIDLVEAESGSTDVDYQKYNDLYTGPPASEKMKAAFSSYKDVLWTTKLERRVRKEGFRLSSHGIVVRGDMSTISGASPSVWTTTGEYISLPSTSLPFDLSASADELGLAYFISPNAAGSTTAPSSIKISVQFVTSDNKIARWNILRSAQTLTGGATTANSTGITYGGSGVVRRNDQLSGGSIQYPTEVYPTSATAGLLGFLTATTATGQTFNINEFNLSVNSSGNAYYTDYIQLNETANARMAMVYDSGFKWANVAEVRVYSSTGSSSHWVGLDSLIFTNVDSMNSTYGMAAYDIAYNYETRGIQTRENSPTNVLFEVKVG